MWKGFLAGLIVANGFEWFAHKYVLHGTHRAGQTRYSPVPDSMRSHWEHHREVRKTRFSDYAYVEGLKNWRIRNEIGSLAVAASVFGLAFVPCPKACFGHYIVQAIIFICIGGHICNQNGPEKIPWHYDHHMNSNQDANWCVTKPWFDYLMGTRVISSADLQEKIPWYCLAGAGLYALNPLNPALFPG